MPGNEPEEEVKTSEPLDSVTEPKEEEKKETPEPVKKGESSGIKGMFGRLFGGETSTEKRQRSKEEEEEESIR